jgi:hypothetical protein
VAIDQTGTAFIAPSFEIGSILRYDRSGSYSGAFGRSGEGPGEYTDSWNMALFAIGDTVVIADPGNKRVTYASSRGDVYRILPVPPASSYKPLPDGMIAFSRNVRTRDQFAYPIHVIDAAGAIKSLTSQPNRSILPGEGKVLEWRLGHARTTGRFWAYSWTEYKLAEWSANGELVGSIVADPAWLRADFRRGGSMAKYRWPTYFAGLREDAQGRIWLLAHVVSENWEVFLPAENPMKVPTPNGFNGLRNTMLEIIERSTGRLIVRDEVDPMIIGFVDDRHVYSLIEDANGAISIQIWELRIINQNE